MCNRDACLHHAHKETKISAQWLEAEPGLWSSTFRGPLELKCQECIYPLTLVAAGQPGKSQPVALLLPKVQQPKLLPWKQMPPPNGPLTPGGLDRHVWTGAGVYLWIAIVNFAPMYYLLTREKAHWVGACFPELIVQELCQPVVKLTVAWNCPFWDYLNHRNHQVLQIRASPTPQSQFTSTPLVLDFFESPKRTGHIVSHM